MPKSLKISFTGSAVLTPPYPDDFGPLQGPLTAIMPGARHVRKSTFRDQISAQFTVLLFPYRHLIVESPQDRDADYKYPDLKDVQTGLCFLENEELKLLEGPPAIEKQITFDNSPTTAFPTLESRGTGYIARWQDFAAGGRAKIKDGVLTNRSDKDFVSVLLPAGEVTSGFVAEPILRVNFDYGENSETRAYAQKIVVTLTYPDETQAVTFAATRSNGRTDPFMITLAWYDATEIEILFANGSLESILNVLRGSFVGQDHDGDYDLEFEVLYDVVDCYGDRLNRLPLPQIRSQETLRVPCIASMVASDNQTAASLALSDSFTPLPSNDAQPPTRSNAATASPRREPGERRKEVQS